MNVTIKIPKDLALVCVAFYVLVIGVFSALDFEPVFPRPVLSATMSTIFGGFLPLFVSVLFVELYIRSSLTVLLLLGAGLFTVGLSVFYSALHIVFVGHVTNFSQTVNNIGHFYASCFHVGSVLMGCLGFAMYQNTRKRPIVAIVFSALAVLVAATILAAKHGWLPLFIAATGSTPMRDLVLFMTTFFYSISAVYFLYQYSQWKSDFLYWYGLALVMFATCQAAFASQEVPSSIIGWIGRSEMWLAGLVLLYAVLYLRKRHRTALPIDQFIGSVFSKKETATNGAFRLSMEQEFKFLSEFKAKYGMLPHQAYLLFLEGKINSLKELLLR